MNLTIEKANEKDAEVIALLARVTFNDTMGGLFVNKEELFNYFDKKFSIVSISKSISNPNNIYFIARNNGVAVGYLKLKINSPLKICETSKISEINRMFILRDFLNKGVGNELHQAMLNEVQKLGIEFMWIPVLEDNLPAQSFCEKLGYEKRIKHLYSVSRYDLIFDIYTKKLK